MKTITLHRKDAYNANLIPVNREYPTVCSSNRDRAWVEISLQEMRHNARVLQNNMPKGCKLMAVVKADAYGHGADKVGIYLNKIGIRYFAVATIDEGISLRKEGV